MTERPKRNAQRKQTEETAKAPWKWNDDEMKTLFDCIQKHGHKNFEMLEKCLPHRSLENIKSFLRTACTAATKTTKGHEGLDFWIKRCSVENSPWKDSIQIAQVIKYLSIDGLLENHPLPENSQGIDFRQAYKFIYQALMGYPIQEINQPTADLILETLADLNSEIVKESEAIKNLSKFLKVSTEPEIKTEPGTDGDETADKKPVKVYERKRKKLQNSEETPSMKIVIEESGISSSGSSKSFSVTVKGSNSSQTTVVDVPVAVQKTVDVDEENLLQSSSYNPLCIPGKWLEEPLYLNMKRKP